MKRPPGPRGSTNASSTTSPLPLCGFYCLDTPSEAPLSSSASASAWYTFRSTSIIARESVATDRPTRSSNTKFQGRDSILPSKMMPTTSAFLLISGLPEFPPMISGVETVSNGVFGSSDDLDFIQLAGNWYGGLLPCLAAWSYVPPSVVYQGRC